MPTRQRQPARQAPPAPAAAPAPAADPPVPATIDEILDEMHDLAANADTRTLTDAEADRYEQLESALTASRRSGEIRARQNAYETPTGGPVFNTAADDDGAGLPSLLPSREDMAELYNATRERRAAVVQTPRLLNATITTTQTGRTTQALGVTDRGGPRRIAELGQIQPDRVEWGESTAFPILGAGTPPSATGEGSAKPEYAAITPGTATPQTLAVWTDVSEQALSLTNFSLKVENKLARLVAAGENELLRAKVAGTAGVVTQAFTAGDQAVQILRAAAIIEAALGLPPSLILYNSADVVAIFGTSVAQASPQEIAELSVFLFGMRALPLTTQPAGFVLLGAWGAGSRLVLGLDPTYRTNPFTQMKNNIVTLMLEEAVDLAVEEPEAFRIVDIVTP